MSKKPSWNWLKDDNSDEVHHIEWPWDYDDSEEGGADDYASSRPWGSDNDG